jgi:hypothetical protein
LICQIYNVITSSAKGWGQEEEEICAILGIQIAIWTRAA